MFNRAGLILNQSNMERADIRQKQIDELNAFWEMDCMEHELRNGLVEDGVVCVVEGEVIEGTHVLIAAA